MHPYPLIRLKGHKTRLIVQGQELLQNCFGLLRGTLQIGTSRPGSYTCAKRHGIDIDGYSLSVEINHAGEYVLCPLGAFPSGILKRRPCIQHQRIHPFARHLLHQPFVVKHRGKREDLFRLANGVSTTSAARPLQNDGVEQPRFQTYILKPMLRHGYEDCGLAWDYRSDWHLSENAIAPDLWRNREVVLSLFRCGIMFRHLLRPLEGVFEQFDNDREMWLQVARIPYRFLFKAYCPASLRSDPQFMRRAVRANHQICIPCLTGDPTADFDLILTACTTSLDFVETDVSRVEDDFQYGEN